MSSSSSSTAAARTLSRPVELLTAIVAAAVATQVKTWAEATLQPVAERLLPPSAREKARLGADPGDQPENMPPAELVDNTAQAVGLQPLSTDAREQSSAVMHWVMGIGAGVTYGLAAHRFPAVRRGRGTLFSAALFAGTHGSLLPAIGTQAPFSQLPRAWWVWEPGSHLIYGACVDGALRLADRRAGRLSGLGVE